MCGVASVVVLFCLAAEGDGGRDLALRELGDEDTSKMRAELPNLLKRIRADTLGAQNLLLLRDFLENKEGVEDALFEDIDVSDVEVEIATMVTNLAHSIMSELRTLAAGGLGSSEQERLVASISVGLQTISRTNSEIETLLRPGHGLETVPLEKTTEGCSAQLAERLDEARAIRGRLSRDVANIDDNMLVRRRERATE